MKLPKEIETIHWMCCGCGERDKMWTAIHNYLENFSLIGDDWTKRTIELVTGEQYFLAYYLDDIGLLDHGSGIGGSWITEQGGQVLEFLRTISPDYDNAIENILDDEEAQ